MKTLLQHIQQASRSPIGVVLYIGAGKGELLPIVRRFDAERLVLCEPNPANVSVLQRELDPTRPEAILPYALVGAVAPSAELHILNNTRYSSTASPLRILDLRSNLKVDRTITIPAKQITSIIEDLDLSTKHTNLLILNAPGSNAALLQAIPSNLLCRFEWLVVTGMQIADAYVGDKPVTDIVDFLLQEQRFDLAMNDGEAIHPNAAALLHRHPLVLRILELEEQSANAERALKDTSQIAEQQHQQLQQLIAERSAQAKLATERTAQIEALTQVKAGAEKLATERQSQIQQLTQERLARDKQLTELKAQLEQTQQAQAQLEGQVKERQAQIENLTKTGDEQATLATEHHSQLQQLTQERDTQAKLAEERAAQIEGLTQAKAGADKLAAERQSQIQQLTQQRDVHDKQLTEHQAQLQQAQQTTAELQKQVTERQAQIESLIKARDEQTKKADQHEKRVVQLEIERTELEARQHLFSEEMVRAEAQIDLIKDVLLREPGL